MVFRREQKGKSEQIEKGNVLYKDSKGQVRAKREGVCPLERNKRTRWSKKRREMSFIRFQKDKASVH